MGADTAPGHQSLLLPQQPAWPSSPLWSGREQQNTQNKLAPKPATGTVPCFSLHYQGCNQGVQVRLTPSALDG